MKNTIAILFSFLIFSSLNAQRMKPEWTENKVDQLAQQLLETAKLPAISIAVAQKGEILYAKSFGMAHVKKKIPASIMTRFRTASVAKIITATAIGRLVSEGRMDLDEPIKNYIPYISTKMADISTRQLMGHLSGVRHRPRKKKNKSYTTQEAVELFNESELLFLPGTDYQYSTNGFTLLAAVIEGVTEKTFLKYMQEEIFDPLLMTNTKGEVLKELNDQDASLYFFKKGKFKRDKRLSDPSYKIAGAGFRTTPTDLVKMMDAYRNGFIREEVVNEMFTTQKLSNGTSTQVGLTWRMNVDPFGRRVVDHAGSWQGARTVVCYYPKEQLSVAVMVNATWISLIEETAQMIATTFLNEKLIEPQISIDENIKAVLTNTQNEVFHYNGNLQLAAGKGLLSLEAEDSFLHRTPLIYLGSKNSYAAFTSFGILYLNLETSDEISGKMYWYQNRNEKSPVEKMPVLSFE